MLQLQLQLHDSEVAERISNDGMNGEAVVGDIALPPIPSSHSIGNFRRGQFTVPSWVPLRSHIRKQISQRLTRLRNSRRHTPSLPQRHNNPQTERFRPPSAVRFPINRACADKVRRTSVRSEPSRNRRKGTTQGPTGEQLASRAARRIGWFSRGGAGARSRSRCAACGCRSKRPSPA